MDYYQAKQFVAQVDKNDKILGKIEKWDAHKKGVLHRGYTCILKFKDNFILQHRKHPVFDGVFDLSFSSHQLFASSLPSRASGASRGISLQETSTAIAKGLKREWNIDKKDLLSEPKFLKKIYYKAKDPKSDYTEHEIDYIYIAVLKNLPKPNLDFYYSFKLVKKLEIRNWKLGINLAPWVKVMIEKKLI